MITDHSPEDVFLIVADRIRKRKKSLRQVRNYRYSGIEGWFKLEAIAALQDYVKEARNKSPDLVVKVHESQMEITLHASTEFDPFQIKLGSIQHKTLCLFLADGSTKEKIEELLSDKDVDMIRRSTFKDNGNKWVVGMIRPSEEYLLHHSE